jgi:alpha-ribazole phosphatase
MTNRLVLARHAAVEPHGSGRFLGSTDLPLCELGTRQAAALARRLQKLSLDQIFSSPLRRARQTVDPLGQDVQVDEELREIDFGRWEGLTFEEISTSNDGGIDRWSSFDPRFTFPGGESLGGFVARVGRAADRLAACAGENVLAVAHGGVIRSMICHLLGLEPKNYLLFDVKPASITTIDLFDGGGTLVGFSDVCHLEGIRERSREGDN